NQKQKANNYMLYFDYPKDPTISKSAKFLVVSNIRADGSAAKWVDSGPSAQLTLNQPLQPGRSVSVEFDLDGKVPQQTAKDLFSETMDELTKMMNPSAQSQSDYGIFSSTKEILNLGMWYAAISKFDANGWDEE